DQSVIIVNPCLGDKLLYNATDQLIASFEKAEEEPVQPVEWTAAEGDSFDKGLRLIIKHNKVCYFF
ncbi:hypothetical protein scyTo_0026183, partial [Scyliorhinus torazame]|nr:hypothetical protein [Scyliorhinus torazame]